MHIAFIDIAYDYTADRPESGKALGGTTSAICFVARELKKIGVECTFFNKVKGPSEALGIKSYPLEALADERRNPNYTSFVFCGRWVEWLVNHVREATNVPLIGWMHENLLVPPFMPALAALDGIVFNSQWQKKINQPHVQKHWQQTTIRNAMNPRFANLFPSDAAIMAAKTKPPILLYAGATPRGAFHLPKILEHLRKRRTDFTMEIYCDCMPWRDPVENKRYKDSIANLPNVTHVGMVGQDLLAERMKRAAILVSPNPWPETSCIAMIEAMAAGLCVITTNRAVLPETSEGFAQHIPIEDADDAMRFDMPMPYELFAEAIDTTMTRWLTEPESIESILRQQADHFVGSYQYAQRAAPWIDFIDSFQRQDIRVVHS